MFLSSNGFKHKEKNKYLYLFHFLHQLTINFDFFLIIYRFDGDHLSLVETGGDKHLFGSCFGHDFTANRTLSRLGDVRRKNGNQLKSNQSGKLNDTDFRPKGGDTGGKAIERERSIERVQGEKARRRRRGGTDVVT
jgi:hypothetical protein